MHLGGHQPHQAEHVREVPLPRAVQPARRPRLLPRRVRLHQPPPQLPLPRHLLHHRLVHRVALGRPPERGRELPARRRVCQGRDARKVRRDVHQHAPRRHLHLGQVPRVGAQAELRHAHLVPGAHQHLQDAPQGQARRGQPAAEALPRRPRRARPCRELGGHDEDGADRAAARAGAGAEGDAGADGPGGGQDARRGGAEGDCAEGRGGDGGAGGRGEEGQGRVRERPGRGDPHPQRRAQGPRHDQEAGH
mmetsp:Transcript_11751/g.29322  ORF Transcript_11751/g.29322 Transcript_11751/m.29322 type:complete len:249 (+) Transcript_11751:1730-2476(+)